MQCRSFACTKILYWEPIQLAYSLGVYYKNQDPFIHMALLKGTKTLSVIPRGKGICKVSSNILVRSKIYNYDNLVETKLDLLFGKLSAWVFVKNPIRLPVFEWTDAIADLNGLVRFAERRNLVSARVPVYAKHCDGIGETRGGQNGGDSHKTE
jgi:hypothetical protein